MDRRKILDPKAKQASYQNARIKFLVVAGLMWEIHKDPSITSNPVFIKKIQDLIAEIDDFGDIADRITQAYQQYAIDTQLKEQHYGV